MANKHGLTLTPECREYWSQNGIFFHTWVEFQLWVQPDVDLLASSHTNLCQHYYTMGNTSTSSKPWGWMLLSILGTSAQLQFSCCFSSISFVQVSSWTCGRSVQIFTSTCTCWIEASWLPTLLGMLEDIPGYFTMVKSFVSDVSGNWVLRFQPSLCFILWLHQDICWATKHSSSSVCQAVVGSTETSTVNVY